jgi:hypothetical protein
VKFSLQTYPASKADSFDALPENLKKAIAQSAHQFIEPLSVGTTIRNNSHI